MKGAFNMRIETDRLILRNAKPEDAAELLEIRNSEFVMQYNCMKVFTPDDAAKEIEKDALSDKMIYMELKETGALIGIISLDDDTLRHRVNSLTLAYYLGENYASKGYMTEALRDVVEYAFEELGVEVLAARVFSENEASLKLIKGLGFKHEGTLRHCVKGHDDLVHDDMVFSIIKEDYLG